MRIALLQTDIEWRNVSGNIASTSRLASGVDADLYLLPEMWSTGFDVEPEDTAEEESESKALRWMMDFSASKGCAVAGSLVVRDGGRLFNRFFFVAEGRTIGRYDKHHLFRPGGETGHVTAGTERVTVCWRGIRFRLATCYDLRFPVWTRNYVTPTGCDYDVLMFVASWPDTRTEVWRTLLRARAIENQCIAVGCNRTGRDPYCSYEGASQVVDSYGNVVMECRVDAGAYVTELPLAHLRDFRERMYLVPDGDGFEIYK